LITDTPRRDQATLVVVETDREHLLEHGRRRLADRG